MLIVTSTVSGKREPMNPNNEENYNERYTPKRETYVIKKDGSLEAFHVQKVIDAIGKSAYRALTKFTPEEKEQICECVITHIDALESTQVPISVMHNIVENALEQVRPIVAKSYRVYRNYKQDFVRIFLLHNCCISFILSLLLYLQIISRMLCFCSSAGIFSDSHDPNQKINR